LQLERVALEGEIEVADGKAGEDVADGAAGEVDIEARCAREFLDQDDAINMVLSANPHIFNHNLETVRRLTPSVRSRATYDRSLNILRKVKAKCGKSVYTKSGLMLGQFDV